MMVRSTITLLYLLILNLVFNHINNQPPCLSSFIRVLLVPGQDKIIVTGQYVVIKRSLLLLVGLRI